MDWDDEIKARIERLSPEARALFSEVWRRGEEFEFMVPPDELVVNLHERYMSELSSEDRTEYTDLHRIIVRRCRERAAEARAEAEQADLLMRLIRRAKELDRRAGRPVKEDMTTGEAISRLAEAGDLDAFF